MSQQGKSAEIRFIADGAAVNIALGFIPDFADLYVNITGTNPNLIHYSRQLEDTQTMYGILHTGVSGVMTRLTSAATGLKALNSKFHQVMIDSPVPGKGEVACDVANWTSTVSTNATARDATSIGTIVRPTTHNGYVYECTTAGTSSGTEPTTWTTTPGNTVTDSDVVFTCREEKIITKGAQGLTVGADVASDNQVCTLIAWALGTDRNAGDAAAVGANAAI